MRATKEMWDMYCRVRWGIPADSVPESMLDFIEIMILGANKYGWNNWMKTNGKKSSEKDMHASMFRHLAQSAVEGRGARDHESHLDPLLHLQCRASMLYFKRKHNIIHDDDV